MEEIYRCSRLLFWLVQTLFKCIHSRIKVDSNIGHYFSNNLILILVDKTKDDIILKFNYIHNKNSRKLSLLSLAIRISAVFILFYFFLLLVLIPFLIPFVHFFIRSLFGFSLYSISILFPIFPTCFLLLSSFPRSSLLLSFFWQFLPYVLCYLFSVHSCNRMFFIFFLVVLFSENIRFLF